MRAKQWLYVAATLLCLATLGSIAADKVVTSKEDGFEITFPESWDVPVNMPGSVAGFKDVTSQHTIRIFVSTIEVKEGTYATPKELGEFSTDNKKKNFSDFEMIDKAE